MVKIETIIKLKDIFDDITCLAVEGVEFQSKSEITEAIAKRSSAGYQICKEIIQGDMKGGQHGNKIDNAHHG